MSAPDSSSRNLFNSRLWSWRYQAPASGTARPIRASGQFLSDTQPDAEGFYAIHRIQGRRNGVRIDGLWPAGEAIPGNIDPITGVPYTGDNRVRENNGDRERAQLTSAGFQFALRDGTFSNVFYAGFLEPPVTLEFHSAPPYPIGAVPPNSEDPVTFRATPLFGF
jgi:hypothetical protein